MESYYGLASGNKVKNMYNKTVLEEGGFDSIEGGVCIKTVYWIDYV